MKKEVLTLSRCREELVELQRIDRKIFVILLLCLMPMIFMMVCIYAIGYDPNVGIDPMDIFRVAFPVAVLLFAIAYTFFYEKYRIRKVKRSELVIYEDTLVLAFDDMVRRSRRYSGVVYKLKFQYFGFFRIPERQNYAWSELYSMSDKGVYNTSILGDRFYIVCFQNDRKKRPLQVYNTKLFELCPDGTPSRSGKSWKDSVSVE